MAVLDGFAFDDTGLAADDAFFDPCFGFAPLEIKGNLHLRGIDGWGEISQDKRQHKRAKNSHL
jgi:hypothetical protein